MHAALREDATISTRSRSGRALQRVSRTAAAIVASLLASLLASPRARAHQPLPAPPVEHDSVDLGLSLPTPLMVVRTTDGGGSLGAGAMGAAFLQLRPSFGILRLSLSTGALRATSATWAPLGLSAGYFRTWRESFHWSHARLFSGLEAGGGALWSGGARPFVELALTPIAIGWPTGFLIGEDPGDGYPPRSTWLVGLRTSVLLLDDGPSGARSFGLGAILLGVSVSHAGQVRAPTPVGDGKPLGAATLERARWATARDAL